MKFRAHDTFAIRKGWLHKGMRHVIDNPRIFVDKTINPMDEFGLGANMVKALRYWLQATGLTEEGTSGNNRNQQLTGFGRLVWDNDPYLEEDGTLFLLHYFLASNEELATAWYYFFNCYKIVEISRENFTDGIKSFLLENDGAQVSDRALDDDFDCIIKTYFSNNENIIPESNMECPLCELGLITSQDSKAKTFSKVTPRNTAINPLVVLAVIIKENQDAENKEIKISHLENAPKNIGKIFNLDSLSVSSYLDKLQNMGYIKVNRTAGLDIIKLTTQFTFEQCVQEYYRSIND